jgi:hypothetical protein
MKLTWLEPLSSFRRSAIDYAFRDYLRNGVGEFFDVHAIVRRCNQYNSLEYNQINSGPKGCIQCRWTGFIYTDQSMKRVKPCACRKDPSLRSEPPKPEEMDYSNVVEMVKETLVGHVKNMPDVILERESDEPSDDEL